MFSFLFHINTQKYVYFVTYYMFYAKSLENLCLILYMFGI